MPQDGTNWLSLNMKNRQTFFEDPLNGVPFTNNGFYTLLSLVSQGAGRNWTEKIPKKLPFLFVSGEDDPIGDFGKGVLHSAEELKKNGFKDVSVKLYPKMRHEILNEDIKKDVFLEITNWINSKIN